MGKQIEFQLVEKGKKQKLKKDAEVEEKVFKLVNELHQVSMTVKGLDNAELLGIPTESLKDMVLIEFGPKNIQTSLLDDIDKEVPTKETEHDLKEDFPDKQKKKKGRPKKT